MLRHLLRLLFFLIGLAAGIFYAWKIDPVRYTDVPLAALRADYRTDYVMAVAEAYQREQDLNLAISRLKLLNPTSPLTPVQEALLYAQTHAFEKREVAFLQSLIQALSTVGAEGGGTP